MQISVDISLYPLKEMGYEQPILDFIAALEKEENVDIVRNELSTQIHGDYAIIMQLLQQEIYTVFEELPDSVFVIKLVGNNRKGIY
ncbi:hypothetical protein PGH07_08165 [Sulfurovum sp. zt1-1]|uniref:Thiamin/hydroxymethyl pyrimidine-binding YkoF putative domain-containing protein n=1 Tax=Sulfurovum zhangzhouensis TaxID=3019067 RepID=A0ABT7QZD5_9BACT|nr:hypothetical protein [Sulfurovum zhangzhouensis]MDM5272152.1 hypothetical protein [Sulfurovum zhangzhouensis]